VGGAVPGGARDALDGLRAVYVSGQAVLATVTGLGARRCVSTGTGAVIASTTLSTRHRPRRWQHDLTQPKPPVGGQRWILHDPQDPKHNVAA